MRRCGRPYGRDGGRAGGRPGGDGAPTSAGQRGTLLAERVSLALSGALGRNAAHELVADAVRRATTQGTSLAEELRIEPAVRAALDPGDEATFDARLAELLDPAGYLGATGTWIDRALAAHAELVAGSPDQTIVRPAR